jgi:hypothetical protein
VRWSFLRTINSEGWLWVAVGGEAGKGVQGLGLRLGLVGGKSGSEEVGGPSFNDHSNCLPRYACPAASAGGTAD